MENIYMVTHGDGDGICAAAIALKTIRAAGSKPELIFAQPFTLCKKIREINKTNKTDNTIYILDLEAPKEILKIKGLFDKIIYIDHHYGSKKIENVFVGRIDMYYSASQLAEFHFQTGDTWLATLGAACDKIVMVHRDDPIRINAEVLRKSLTYDVNDDIFRAYLVDQLSKDQKPVDMPEAVKRSKKADRAFKECRNLAGKNIIFNEDIVITHLGEDFRGVVSATATSLAIEFKKPVFVIYPVENYMVITARSHRDNDINLGKLMERFSGGGHRVAASGAVRDEKDIGKIADRIRKEVKKIEGKK